MDEAKKRQLVDYSKEGCTLEGSPTTVAGLKNDEASLAPRMLDLFLGCGKGLAMKYLEPFGAIFSDRAIMEVLK